MTTYTVAEPVNDKQFVTGAVNTFVFNVDSGAKTYPDGGVELELPTGFQAFGGMAILSGTPTADVTFAGVIVADGEAKLMIHGADYKQSIGHAFTACAVVYAKRG